MLAPLGAQRASGPISNRQIGYPRLGELKRMHGTARHGTWALWCQGRYSKPEGQKRISDRSSRRWDQLLREYEGGSVIGPNARVHVEGQPVSSCRPTRAGRLHPSRPPAAGLPEPPAYPGVGIPDETGDLGRELARSDVCEAHVLEH